MQDEESILEEIKELEQNLSKNTVRLLEPGFCNLTVFLVSY